MLFCRELQFNARSLLTHPLAHLLARVEISDKSTHETIAAPVSLILSQKKQLHKLADYPQAMTTLTSPLAAMIITKDTAFMVSTPLNALPHHYPWNPPRTTPRPRRLIMNTLVPSTHTIMLTTKNSASLASFP